MDLRTWVTKDMGYRNYVLWSDETKINLFGSESHLNRKLSGRKKCGIKRCTTNRENRSLMRIVKQNRFKNLGELHKKWTEAGVKASRATTHRRVKEFGYSCHRRHLTWAKEKKNWTVA